MVPSGDLCERARTWAALAPDGELSELERKLLDSHLTRCGACGRFAAEVAAFAADLRTSALQPLRRPVTLPVWRRRPAYARMRVVGAAAAVAVMAIGIASRSPLPAGERESQPATRVTNFSTNEQRELAQIRAAEVRPANVEQLRPIRPGRSQPA